MDNEKESIDHQCAYVNEVLLEMSNSQNLRTIEIVALALAFRPI